eukprot:SAG31_NODE_3959_length_3718_cov_1.526389_5_plen_91_part_00
MLMCILNGAMYLMLQDYALLEEPTAPYVEGRLTMIDDNASIVQELNLQNGKIVDLESLQSTVDAFDGSFNATVVTSVYPLSQCPLLKKCM